MAREAGLPLGLATTAVLMPGEEPLLRAVLDARPDAVLVRNLAALKILCQEAPGLPLVGDYHLNVANEVSAAALLGAGLERLTACLDLPAEAVLSLVGRLPAGAMEAVLRLRVPMFHTAHCLWAGNLGPAAPCERCGRADAPGDARGRRLAANHGTAPGVPPCGRIPLRLRDRVGEEHVVLADAAGRNTVFASRERSVLPEAGGLARAGVRWFRVELVDETAEEALRVIEEVVEAIRPK
jgi:putative protease